MERIAEGIPVIVLVANEPRAYREAVAFTLTKLRPRARVIQAEPAAIEAALLRERPHVAIGSRFVPGLDAVLAWAILSPDSRGASIISAGGARSTHAEISFDDLLALVDQVAEQLQA